MCMQVVKNNAGETAVTDLLSDEKDTLTGSVVIPGGFGMEFNG